MRKLERKDGKIGGVCGGLGHYLGIDPNVFRLIFLIPFLLLAIFSGLGALIVAFPYVVMWLFLPKSADQPLS